ncbi:MAG: DNA primase, partial [Caldilineaceae bacterium]|nr:DNA primase [Caldilineaceae bacterium]
NEAGVDFNKNADVGADQQRKLLYEINKSAAAYFADILQHHPAAQPARSYLDRRGIDAATRERFQLGFALDSWNSLRDYLGERGYAVEQLLTAGLVKQNEARDSIYDAFRNRVMIPIRDQQGRLIGFGGRVLGDDQPKYLNTAETPVFHKSHVVYGLDLAYEPIRSAGNVVIVEGYMDVIAGHQHGFSNLVACMGTSLTADQLRQLQRFTNDFIFALDADSAGQQATIRGLNQARQALTKVRRPTFTRSGQVRLADRLGANLFVTSMPAGRDPDDVIRQDPSLWQQLVAQAQPLVDFYFQTIQAQVDLQSARGKGEAVAELAPLIAELDDEIERQHYVQQLSRLVQIDEMVIAGRVQASARTSHIDPDRKNGRTMGRIRIGRNSVADDAPPPDDEVNPSGPEMSTNGQHPQPSQRSSSGGRKLVVDVGQGIRELEDHLLANLLREPDLFVWLAQECERLEISPLSGSDFNHVENQEILRALNRFIHSDEPWSMEVFQDILISHLHGRLGRLVVYGLQQPACNTAGLKEHTLKALIRLRIQRLSAKITHVRFLQEDASRDGSEDDAKDLLTINNKSTRELFHLQRVLLRRERPEQGMRVH